MRSALEPSDFGVVAAIFAMAAATYLTRTSGFWLMAHVSLTPRLRNMLEALPGAVVVAIVLPIVAKAGAPAMASVVVATGIMTAWRNEFLAVAIGVVVAAGVRAAGF